jgi:hypothetical protein
VRDWKFNNARDVHIVMGKNMLEAFACFKFVYMCNNAKDVHIALYTYRQICLNLNMLESFACLINLRNNARGVYIVITKRDRVVCMFCMDKRQPNTIIYNIIYIIIIYNSNGVCMYIPGLETSDGCLRILIGAELSQLCDTAY